MPFLRSDAAAGDVLRKCRSQLLPHWVVQRNGDEETLTLHGSGRSVADHERRATSPAARMDLAEDVTDH
jgi:hypothetical protein